MAVDGFNDDLYLAVFSIKLEIRAIATLTEVNFAIYKRVKVERINCESSWSEHSEYKFKAVCGYVPLIPPSH